MEKDTLNELEISVEEDFTEDELLIVKGILSMKALSGATSRTRGVTKSLIDKKDYASAEHLVKGFETIEKIEKEINGVLKEYSKRIGINEHRYRELWNFVYEKEQEL